MKPERMNHIDGGWHTSYSEFKGHKLEIKMQPYRGCKIHIWDAKNSKVLKTLRYSFSSYQNLISKAEQWINQNIMKGGINER